MTRKKAENSKRSFAVAMVLLLVTQIVMGVVLMTMSKRALREQIEQRMMDVANTAAFQLNGDELEQLTADDVGSETYNKSLMILRSFQENIQLDYIYAIRAEADGSFTFLIDPELERPGAFGSPVKTTDALKDAAGGTACIDKVPYTDSWGRFYSAYSPVFDSEGNVASIVGVDFNADWYDSMLNSHKAVVIILTMIALTIGIVFVFMSRTFVLTDERNQYRQKLEETLQREQAQEQALGSARHMAYTDPLTGVKSKRAYLEAMEQLDKHIAEKSVKEFGLIVFDLNGLKTVNDTLGHEEGDRYIQKGCALICAMFSHSPVFRIGGDEFAVLLEGRDYERRDMLLRTFDDRIEENQEKGDVVISTGMELFDPAHDFSYSSVFARADKKMYVRKRLLKSMQA